jgi:hypothetical protein
MGVNITGEGVSITGISTNWILRNQRCPKVVIFMPHAGLLF